MNWRYRFIFFTILLFLGIIVVRLFYWQIVKAEDLTLLAKSQYSGRIKFFPVRGEIKTTDNFPIATNKVSYLVFANPKEVKDKDKTVNLLSLALEVDRASISSQLSLDLSWVPIKSEIDSIEKEKINNLRIPGIGFEQQFTRFYPEASLAAQLLGFVGKDESGQSKGYFGIEGYYDRLLRGKEGYGIEVRDALGRPILGKLEGNLLKVDGSNLVLSLDRSVQFQAERKLKEGVEAYGAKGGMVGIIEPKTGNILAIASYPSFDQAHYQNYPEELFKNPFISNTYEPGSTFKPLVMSAALDAGVVTPETRCPICDKPVSIGGYDIHTWNNKYYKNINMIDVIMRSDNTGMVYVAQKLGLSRMLYYLDKFGIGKLADIDLQGEVAPILKSKNNWYPVDLATAGFGQGISVTPLELLDAFSAIANQGKRMQPRVVSQVGSPNGEIFKISPKVLDTPISEKTAKVMTEMLVNAVNKGEAQWARLKGYRIAGKTGTASIPLKGHYDPSQTITSFIGFAPADRPKFAMLVIIDRPTTSIYGAETAAPVFFDIARDLLSYYNIPPSE